MNSTNSYHLLFILCLIAVNGCSQAPAVIEAKKYIDVLDAHISEDSLHYLDSLFTLAMLDAQNPEPSEIDNKLTNILNGNSTIDTLINHERYVLMVSWKFNPKWFPDSGAYNTSGFDVWVTAAPEIQNKCIKYFESEKLPILRLRQLLGLQPFTQETFFLELWVKPDQLFRPCPDPDISDTACGLSIDQSIGADYRKWFNHTRAFQYNDCTDTLFHEYGYPWTQLGYTYDWGADNPTHIGLSEFVIKQQSDVYVRGKYATKTYCAQQ